MKLDDLKTRINELIALGDRTLATKYTNRFGDIYVTSEAFTEFRAASLSFLKSVFAIDHPFYKDFDRAVTDISPYMTEQGRGILRGAKQEIDGGWIFTIKGLVSAEIFVDFLEMAEHLLDEKYKDPAAVMIGSVLEEHLRQLCIKYGIAITDAKNGKAKKADLLNSELANSTIYNKLDQKNVTAWLDLRNKAAHGKYSDYNQAQVESMLKAVTEFMARHSV